MARPAGFEPTTPWFVAKYSIQLSYGRLKAGQVSADQVLLRILKIAHPSLYQTDGLKGQSNFELQPLLLSLETKKYSCGNAGSGSSQDIQNFIRLKNRE